MSSGRKSRMPRAGPVGCRMSVCRQQCTVCGSSERRPMRSQTANCLLRTANSYGRVLDPELIEVGLVPRRVVVVLLHLRTVLLHDALVQPDRRLILRPQQRFVLGVLCLDVPEIRPRLLDE